jgi:hypothetical protein
MPLEDAVEFAAQGFPREPGDRHGQVRSRRRRRG